MYLGKSRVVSIQQIKLIIEMDQLLLFIQAQHISSFSSID